jgi:hypothetical protein
MATRIRYTKKDNKLISPEFLAVNKLVYVEINMATFNVEVFDKKMGLFRHSVQTNMQNAKKFAKKTLVELGVIFEQEVRPRFKLIKDDLGPDASKTYKDDLFEDETESDDFV